MRIWKALAVALLLWGCATASAVGEVFIDAAPAADWNTRDLLRLTVFATGASDCMLLEAGGESMMIDGGIGGSHRLPLAQALKERGIQRFTYMLNTHYHADHLTGLKLLLEDGFQADVFLTPYKEAGERTVSLLKETMAVVRKSGVAIRRVSSGDVFSLGDASITLYRFEDGDDTNARSVIEHIRYGEATLLLCADLSGAAQRYFLKQLTAEELQADVMKAPHHGINAVVTEFLDAVNPSVEVITSDEKRGQKCYRQALNRQIAAFCSAERTTVLETDGKDWYVYQNDGF
ncbi:MAG: MBL fold metallo-hydrolase [Eubacteriales bacterium]|nr:MBL fold metallo-hydrolase [Eubacteriales bacterium]